MTLPVNLKALLAQAERTQSAAAWEALARNLMREKGFIKPKAKPAAKKAKPAAIDPATLTFTECRARGITPLREKFGGGAYVYVLVTFKDGVRILAGQYPRAKDAANRSAAIGNARARYLLTVSGGLFMDAKAKIPAVASVRDIVDASELEQLRDACARQRAALETFLYVPHWDGDTPRPMSWVKERYRDSVRITPDGRRVDADPKWVALIVEHDQKPLWWRMTYRP